MSMCLQLLQYYTVDVVTGRNACTALSMTDLCERNIFTDVWDVYQWDLELHCLNRSLHRSPVNCFFCGILCISVNRHNISEMAYLVYGYFIGTLWGEADYTGVLRALLMFTTWYEKQAITPERCHFVCVHSVVLVYISFVVTHLIHE